MSIQKYLLHIRYKLKKLTFNSIKKSDILLYDQMGEQKVRKYLLYELDYTVLAVRFEKFYINNYIILNMIIGIIKFEFLSIAKIRKPRHIIRNLYLLYLLSCIEYVSPKIIITLIDNSLLFYILSNKYKKGHFIAVQNGCRTSTELEWLILNRSSYYCFGHHELVNLKRNNPAKNCYPVGSLFGGFYKYHDAVTSNIDYDVCLAHQFRERVVFGDAAPHRRHGINRLNLFFSEFIKRNPHYRVCVASTWDDDLEINYLKKFYSEDIIKRNNRTFLNTYHYMDRSKVIITKDSTAVYEAFGWGEKVLFCNFTGTREDYISIPKMNYIEEEDYMLFEAKLKKLIVMDINYYRQINKDSMKYLMNYNPAAPPHQIIREKIMTTIKSPAPHFLT